MTPPIQTHQIISFFRLGLNTNAAYVLMLASAKEISEGSVALVFVSNVAPALLVKLSSPMWFHKISYNARMALCLALLFIGFQLTAFGNNYEVQLLGVMFCSAQSGLGEASFLAITSNYNPHTSLCLTCWSSGTGFAGVFGFGWKWFFMDTLGVSFRDSLLIANTLIAAFGGVYCTMPSFTLSTCDDAAALVGGGGGGDDEEETTSVESNDSDTQPPSEKDSVSLIPVVPSSHPAKSNPTSLLPVVESKWTFIRTKLYVYMIPLFLVYFSEYAMQSGTWAAIGFPNTSEDARKEFYTYSNWLYQAGVFVSRSSGQVVKANMLVLQVMPILQAGLLTLFTLIATYEFMYGWGLLSLCFVAGLLGGGVYVNAFTRISVDVEKGTKQELALAIVSVADSFGIMCADVFGLYLQSCIYEKHGILGAKVNCPF
jgi:battenin